MIPDSYRTLFELLYQRTMEREVNWRATADPDVYVVYFKNFSLSMRRGFDYDDQTEFIRYEILNDEGKEIDAFWIDETEEDWDRASELANAARRKATRLDDAIALMIKELESDKPVGLDKRASANPFADEDDTLPF